MVYFRYQIRPESRLVPVKVPIGCKYVTVPISAADRPLSFQNATDTTSEHNVTVLGHWSRDGFPLQWPDFKELMYGLSKDGWTVWVRRQLQTDSMPV